MKGLSVFFILLLCQFTVLSQSALMVQPNFSNQSVTKSQSTSQQDIKQLNKLKQYLTSQPNLLKASKQFKFKPSQNEKVIKWMLSDKQFINFMIRNIQANPKTQWIKNLNQANKQKYLFISTQAMIQFGYNIIGENSKNTNQITFHKIGKLCLKDAWLGRQFIKTINWNKIKTDKQMISILKKLKQFKNYNFNTLSQKQKILIAQYLFNNPTLLLSYDI